MISCSSIVRAGGVTSGYLIAGGKINGEATAPVAPSNPSVPTPTPQLKKIASDSVQKVADTLTSGSNEGGLDKVDTYGMLMGTSQTAGGFTDILTNVTTELNSVYGILTTLVFIIAVCLIYLGLFQYSKANGGQAEAEGKQTIKKAVMVIFVLASLSSAILLVYYIAQTLVFV